MRLHRGIKVLWAGFESDTYSLQEKGWQISAEEECNFKYKDSFMGRIALKHPHFDMYALSQSFEISHLSHQLSYRNYSDGDFDLFKNIPYINICHMSSRIMINVHVSSEHELRWQPVESMDVRDQYQRFERKMIQDVIMFKPINKENEFIIKQSSVPELMDIILDKQKDVQKHIREKRQREFRQFARKVSELRNDPKFFIEKETEWEDNRSQIVAQLITV